MQLVILKRFQYISSYNHQGFVLNYSDYANLFSRSPDCNALDLGAWRSLAAGVPSLKGKDKSGRLIDRIIFHVLDRWNSWDAAHRLMNIFNTKSRIMKAVSLVNGSNEYKIPRSEFSHATEKATYIPPKISREIEEESEIQVEEGFSNEQRDDYSDIEVDVEGEEEREVNGAILRNEVFSDRVSQTDEIVQWWNSRRSSYEKQQ